MRLARGDVVAFLDSDDRWLPDHLETVVGMLEHHPEAVLATTCPLFRVGGRQAVPEARLVDMIPALFISNQTGYPTCVAVRREALRAIRGFDERLEVGSDLMAFMRLALLGPFSMLSRRTVVPQFTRGSLKERGVARAGYLAAWKLVAEEAVRRVPAEDEELAGRAAGGLVYWEALDSLNQGNYDIARERFAVACEAWPELSESPHLVSGRLENITWDPVEILRLVSQAALLWPDPHSDTALFLRAQTALRALRTGRPRVAAHALAGWPLRDTPGFVRRTRPLWTRRARMSVQRLVHRGREPLLPFEGASETS